MRRGCFLLTLLYYCTFVQIVHGATPSPGAGVSITFSEVSACEESEWVELYNSADQDISVTGWKIEKKGEGSSTWSSKPVDGTIATISARMYRKINVGSSFLSNSGFSLRLKDAAGDTVDENVFGKCPTGSAPTSWIKEGEDWKLTSDITPDSANTLVVAATPQPTADQPVAVTSTPTARPQTPTPTSAATATPGIQPTGISLSEVYACQNENEKEWVELFNTGSTAVTLTDWKLVDDDKNEQPIASLSIGGNGYAVAEITKYTKGMLTNSGDVANLVDGAGKVVDTFTYASCEKGSSWAKIGAKWEETSQSKGTSNPKATASPQPEGDGGDIRVASTLGSEESSASGYILGTQDEATPPPAGAPDPSPLPKSTSNQSAIWVAYLAIGTGIVIILATGLYSFITFRAKSRKL